MLPTFRTTPALTSYVSITFSPPRVDADLLQKFVPVSQFKEQVPCFNVTSEEFVEKEDDDESSAFRLNAASGLGAAAIAFFVSFMV